MLSMFKEIFEIQHLSPPKLFKHLKIQVDYYFFYCILYQGLRPLRI